MPKKGKLKEFYKGHKVLSITVIILLILTILVPFLFKFFFISIIITVLLNAFLLKVFVKNKFLRITLNIFLVLLMSYLLALGIKWVQVLMTGAPTERNYVDYMTGVVEPMSQILITSSDLSRLQSDNVNTLTLYPSTYVPWYLSWFYELEKPYLIGIIKEAKRQGLAVRVSGQSGPTDIPDNSLSDDRMNLISNRVLEWAEISERLGVEYFSPWTEVDTIGFQKAVDWHAEILPQIREQFSGRVFAGWTCCSSDDVYLEDRPETPHDDTGQSMETIDAFIKRINSSSDFDGVMLDIPMAHFEEWQVKYFWNSSLPLQESDSWRPNSIEDIIIATSQRAEEMGIPIYIGEFFLYPDNAVGQSVTGGKIKLYNATEMAEHYDLFLGMVMPQYDGVIHCGLIFGPTGHYSIIEGVVADNYGEYV